LPSGAKSLALWIQEATPANLNNVSGNNSTKEDDSMLSDDGTPSLEDRLHIQDNSDTGKTSLQSPARPPLTDDQLCVLQQTVQQAMKNSRSQPSVSQDVQPFLPWVNPAGTVSPLGLHRPLDRIFVFFEEKKICGEAYSRAAAPKANWDPRTILP